MDNTSKIMEDSCTEKDIDDDSLAQEVSEWQNISNWYKDHSCDNFAMNVAAFSPSPKDNTTQNDNNNSKIAWDLTGLGREDSKTALHWLCPMVISGYFNADLWWNE